MITGGNSYENSYFHGLTNHISVIDLCSRPSTLTRNAQGRKARLVLAKCTAEVCSQTVALWQRPEAKAEEMEAGVGED